MTSTLIKMDTKTFLQGLADLEHYPGRDQAREMLRSAEPEHLWHCARGPDLYWLAIEAYREMDYHDYGPTENYMPPQVWKVDFLGWVTVWITEDLYAYRGPPCADSWVLIEKGRRI